MVIVLNQSSNYKERKRDEKRYNNLYISIFRIETKCDKNSFIKSKILACYFNFFFALQACELKVSC